MFTYLLELFTVNIITIVFDVNDIDDAVVGADIDNVGDTEIELCSLHVYLHQYCIYSLHV